MYEKILLRAIRAFPGIPKRALIPGVLSEMNWMEPRSRTQIRMIRHFKRLNKLDNSRLTKKIYLWDRQLNDSGAVKSRSPTRKMWNSQRKLKFEQQIYGRLCQQ